MKKNWNSKMGSRSPPFTIKVKQKLKHQNLTLESKGSDPVQRTSRKKPGKMSTVHESPFQVQISHRLHRPNNPECSTCKVRGQESAKKMAVLTCHVCNIYLCCACAKKHTSVKNERHFISSISLPTTRESENEVDTKNGHHLLVCSEQGHKDTPKYFCETCEDVICLECIENGHKKHRYLYAKDAYPKHRAVLEENVDRAHGEAIRISKKLHHEENVLNNLKVEKEEVSKKIRQQTAKLTEALRLHEEQLLTNLDKMYAQKEEIVSKNKERCQNRLDLINRTCKFTEMALNDANEVQVLVFKKYANKRLEEICRSEILTTETKDVNLNYFVPENSTDHAKTFMGVVVDTAVSPSHCVAHGEGLSRVIVGQEASFVVTAKNKRDTPLTTGGDGVRVDVSSTREEVILPRIFDLRNGKYRVTYMPKLSGVVTISVRMYDLPIKNSEFKANAVCQRDYNKVEKPFLTIGGFSYLTDHTPFNLPCGATVDDEGRILVADCHNHCIKIMNREGKLVKSFGSFGNKNGQLNNPTDVAISGDKIFVCDKDNNRVQYFTPDGAFLGKFSIGCGQLKRPWGLCVDGRGHIVVLDTRNDRVQVFSEDGGFVTSFGSRGIGHCEFLQPYFAAVHKNGNIYITDNGNHRVQVFDDSYGYLFEFGNDGGELALKNPTGITVDHEGSHVIVADQCNSRVQVFGQDGSRVAVISEALNYPHYQSYPKGLAVTQDGYIVVADSDNDRVVLL